MHYFNEYYTYCDAYFSYKGFGFCNHTIYLNQRGLTLDLCPSSYIDIEYNTRNKKKLVSMLDDINLDITRIFKLIEEISKQVSANNFSFGEKCAKYNTDAHYLNKYTIITMGTGKNYKCVHMLSYSCKILNRITSCEITSRELKSLLGLDDVYGSAIFGQLPAAARRVEQFLIKLKTC